MKDNVKSNAAPLASMIHILFSYWYFFVISIAVCVIMGYIYSQSITERYSAQANILLKDSSDNSSPDSAIMEDLGVAVPNSSVENEIVVLKSSNLIANVVDELNLGTKYSIKHRLREVNIYGANPIAVDWIDKSARSRANIEIEILSLREFKYRLSTGNSSLINDLLNLIGLRNNKPQEIEEQRANFGDTISINNLRFSVRPTESWGNAYAKSTINVELTPNERSVAQIRKNLTIYRTDRSTGAVFIGYSDTSNKLAFDIINKLIDVYNENVINKKNHTALSTEQFIANRISLIYEDLGAIDSRLEDIKKNNNVTDLSSASSVAYEQRLQYDKELSAIDLQTALIESVRQDLNMDDDEYKLLPPNKLFEDIGILEQVNSYNALVAELLEISSSSGRRNPIYVTLAKEVQLAKDNLIIAADNLNRTLQLQKERILTNSNKASSQLSNLLGHEKIVKDVMREQSIKEQLYLYLLNKREANAMQLAVTESNAIIIEPTTSSGFPIAPNVPFILLIAGIVGFALPVGVYFGITVMDDKIRTKEYIEEHSKIPVLGIIIKRPKAMVNDSIVVAEDSKEVINEVFRMVCNELDVITMYNSKDTKEESRARVIHTISSVEGEGKTFVTLNIALSCAHLNNKVLIIDCDMRRKGLSKLLKANKETGFADYLYSKTENLQSLICKSEYSDNLDYLSVGETPTNPVTLLKSARFEEAIKQLRSQYDYIFIDSTPYFVVADASIINRIADNTMWIMRAGVAPKAIMGNLNKLYSENRLVNPAILVNDVDIQNKLYNYSYSYSYNYTYSYTEESKKPKKNFFKLRNGNR